MESYWILTIKDNGRKKYYADEDGWVEDKSEAVWFTDYDKAWDVAHREILREEFMSGYPNAQITIEEGRF